MKETNMSSTWVEKKGKTKNKQFKEDIGESSSSASISSAGYPDELSSQRSNASKKKRTKKGREKFLICLPENNQRCCEKENGNE